MSDATAVQAMQRHLSECEVARRALVERALKLESALRACLDVLQCPQADWDPPLNTHWRPRCDSTVDDNGRTMEMVRAVLAEVTP